MKEEYKVIKTEDNVEISLHLKKEQIGKLILEIMDIDTFIDYEINDVLENNKITKSQKNKLEEISEKIKNNNNVFIIESLNIKKEHRKNNYGTKLMNFSINYMKENSSEMKNSCYINACPNYDDDMIDLDNLVKFYEKFGFKKMLKYNNNCEMITENISMLKRDKKIEKIKKINNNIKLKKENNIGLSLI